MPISEKFQILANISPLVIYWSSTNYVTLHTTLVSFICVWRHCVAQIFKSLFWSEVNFNGFPTAQGVGSKEHLRRDHVYWNMLHAHSSLLTSWLSELGVLTERYMQNRPDRQTVLYCISAQAHKEAMLLIVIADFKGASLLFRSIYYACCFYNPVRQILKPADLNSSLWII